MKKYLLPKGGNVYKANLHCHTNVSDGSLSPEEIKKYYMDAGYSIVAYTDHNVLIAHPELADENFLPLNGLEIDIDERNGMDWRKQKTCHICMIALDSDNIIQPCFNRKRPLYSNSPKYLDKVKFDESKPDWEYVYSPAGISAVMQEARRNGFFVTYNHPVWSIENYNEYANYHGMHAMEICNYSCMIEGYPEYNEAIYDDMLRAGERIFCVSADDNHNHSPFGSKRWDSFGGFVMIKADKLEYKTITDALVAGNFYASQGPEIYDLWFENGRINVTCSDAECIRIMCGQRRTEVVYAEDGKPLRSSSFEVLPDDEYIRVTVVNDKGQHANTSAYFTDELF